MPRVTATAPGWLRVLLPVVLVLIWLGGMGVGGPVFGKISEVQTNDQATFLPASAESTEAGDWVQRFNDSEDIPALLVAGDAGELSEQQIEDFGTWAGELGDLDGVTQVVPPQTSEDGEALQSVVLIDADTSEEVVEALRDAVADRPEALTDLSVHVGGPAGLSADLAAAFAGIDGLLLVVALVAVFIILVFVYRSILLPILVLLNSVAAVSVSILVVYWMASSGWIVLNGQSQGILSILVIGAATDYSLLLVARYREELQHYEDSWKAVEGAVRGSFGAISASASTVALALLCLLFTDLNSNRSLGPVAATGIAFAWLSSLTFLPAVLAIFRRAAFWPVVPHAGERAGRHRPVVSDAPGLEVDHGIWNRVGGLVAAHPRRVWVITALALALGSAGLLQLRADGVEQTQLILGESDAKDAQTLLGEHFDAGTGSPAQIIVPADRAEEFLERIEATDGVASATLTGENGRPVIDPEALREAAESGEGGPPPGVTEGDGEAAESGESGPPPGVTEGDGEDAGAGGGAPPTEPVEVEGRVYIQATLTDAADSSEAEQTVRTLRTDLREMDDSVLVGGTSATQLDTNETAQNDLRIVIPSVLLMLLVILAVLLRSVAAPVLLVAATVLSFGTAMGISALVFNHLFDFPGADPSVPLYGFVFLVALGIDYTIFLMTRAREETGKRGTRAGVLRALTVTGGVITSAGVVLAATFAALAVIPLMFMVQLAFIVAFGVLLDTIVVRSLLIPALSYDLGPKVWWPAKVDP